MVPTSNYTAPPQSLELIKELQDRCLKKALFLYKLSGGWSFFIFFVLIVVVILASCAVYSLAMTPENWFDGATPLPAKPATVTVDQNPNSPSHDSEPVQPESDLVPPPSYNEAAAVIQATDLEAENAQPTSPLQQRNPKTAEAFVIGSGAWSVVVFSIFTQALAIQNMLDGPCNRRVDSEPESLVIAIILWLMFALECLFVCFLVLECWIHLVIDLWGKPPKNGKVLHTGHGGEFFGFMLVPVIMLPFIFGVLLVELVRYCQKTCCPPDLADEGDLEMGAVVDVVEEPLLPVAELVVVPDAKKDVTNGEEDEEEEDDENHGGESSRLLQ